MNNISSKYIGLLTGGLMVMVSVIMFYQFHYPDTGIVKYVCFSIYLVGILLSLFNFNSKNKAAEFKEYFSEGFKTFVIVVLIMAIFTFIFYKINPQIFEKTIEEINKINAQDPNKTAHEVQENGDMLRSIKLPMTVAINTMLYMVMGAFITLIGAGFLSQKRIY